MFDTVLMANRGDQRPQGRAAAKPSRAASAGREGEIAAETSHV
jgi:hypothetical protein